MKTGVTIALVTAALAGAPVAWSQQKYTLKDAESVGDYTEERKIDVGDVPGHQLRVYRLRYEYPKKDLVFLDMPVTESYATGMSNYTNTSGSFTTFSVYHFADGSRIFSHGTGSTQGNPDGSRKYIFTETLTGGTGRFAGIQGQIRGGGERAAGSNTLKEYQGGEYWIEK
jgi:hypothetical protein